MVATTLPRHWLSGLFLALCVLLAGGCTLAGSPVRATGQETVLAVTESNRLVRFTAGQPGRLVSSRPLVGLRPGETVLGMDHRPTDHQLFAVGSSNRLYRVDPLQATATPVNAEPFALPLTGSAFGVAFDPASGRLVVIGDTGQRLRIDVDRGSVVDVDERLPGVQTGIPLAYAPEDAQAGKRPALVATAFGPTGRDPSTFTHYAIDAAWGVLVTIGPPAADTASGQFSPLHTVGELGAGPFERASFTIPRGPWMGYAALTPANATASTWVEVDLKTGAARRIGPIGGPEAVRAVALEP